jgi:hypothetical protein
MSAVSQRIRDGVIDLIVKTPLRTRRRTVGTAHPGTRRTEGSQ